MITAVVPSVIAAEIRRRRDRVARHELRGSMLVALAALTADYFRTLDRWELAAESDAELVAAAAALDAAEEALRSAIGVASRTHAVRETPQLEPLADADVGALDGTAQGDPEQAAETELAEVDDEPTLVRRGGAR
jgi:hypothetical protein